MLKFSKSSLSGITFHSLTPHLLSANAVSPHLPDRCQAWPLGTSHRRPLPTPSHGCSTSCDHIPLKSWRCHGPLLITYTWKSCRSVSAKWLPSQDPVCETQRERICTSESVFSLSVWLSLPSPPPPSIVFSSPPPLSCPLPLPTSSSSSSFAQFGKNLQSSCLGPHTQLRVLLSLRFCGITVYCGGVFMWGSSIDRGDRDPP